MVLYYHSLVVLKKFAPSNILCNSASAHGCWNAVNEGRCSPRVHGKVRISQRQLEDGEVGINHVKLIAKYTIFAIPDNFVAQ